MALRPYQMELIDRTFEVLLRKWEQAEIDAPIPGPLPHYWGAEGPHPISAIVQMATGGGKTHSMLTLIHSFLCGSAPLGQQAREALGRPLRAAFLADLIEINDDTYYRFAGGGLDVGMVAASAPAAWCRPAAPVQVCQVQTLTRGGEVPPADLLILDEAHISEAAQLQELLRRWNPLVLVGPTATPSRGDGRGLGNTFAELVAGPQTGWLQQHGQCAICGTETTPGVCPKCPFSLIQPYLVDCEVIAPAPKYLERGLARDPVLAYRGLGWRGTRPSRAIVFCQDTAHAKKVAASFESAGIAVERVGAATARAARRGLRGRLERGETLVMVSVDVGIKGLDAPCLDTVIIARGVQVPGIFLQMIGRVLRPDGSTGKEKARVIDLRGCVYLHGLPQEDRVWSLGEDPIRRANPAAAFARCPSCLGLWSPPVPTCPSCGAAIRGTNVIRPPHVLREQKMARVAEMSPEQRRDAYFGSMLRRAVQMRIPDNFGRCECEGAKLPTEAGRQRFVKQAVGAKCRFCGAIVKSPAGLWAAKQTEKWAKKQGLVFTGAAAS